MTPRTRAGLVKFRPIRQGSRVALVATSSPFDRAAFDAGVAELVTLGLDPVFDAAIFERHPIVAGPASTRARALAQAVAREDVDAVVAVRGGYGSAELLPLLSAELFLRARTAVVGYSDVTSLHAYLNGHVGLASVHGAMIDGRLSKGTAGFDRSSFLASLGAEPLGEVATSAMEVLRSGDASGPIFGGTLMQIAASLGTPYAFRPEGAYVLFIEDVNERPYRLRRLLTQCVQSGCFDRAVAVVVGELNGCDEPGGTITAHEVLREFFIDFPGPVVTGFPSGHTSGPMVSMPFGVDVRVSASGASAGRAVVEFKEAAAG